MTSIVWAQLLPICWFYRSTLLASFCFGLQHRNGCNTDRRHFGVRVSNLCEGDCLNGLFGVNMHDKSPWLERFESSFAFLEFWSNASFNVECNQHDFLVYLQLAHTNKDHTHAQCFKPKQTMGSNCAWTTEVAHWMHPHVPGGVYVPCIYCTQGAYRRQLRSIVGLRSMWHQLFKRNYFPLLVNSTEIRPHSVSDCFKPVYWVYMYNYVYMYIQRNFKTVIVSLHFVLLQNAKQ